MLLDLFVPLEQRGINILSDLLELFIKACQHLCAVIAFLFADCADLIVFLLCVLRGQIGLAVFLRRLLCFGKQLLCLADDLIDLLLQALNVHAEFRHFSSRAFLVSGDGRKLAVFKLDPLFQALCLFRELIDLRKARLRLLGQLLNGRLLCFQQLMQAAEFLACGCRANGLFGLQLFLLGLLIQQHCIEFTHVIPSYNRQYGPLSDWDTLYCTSFESACKRAISGNRTIFSVS